MQIAGRVRARRSAGPPGWSCCSPGLVAIVYLGFEIFRLDKIPRERMFVVLILTFFSMLFWAFFEQAGSSVNNFTDRNVDRVFEERTDHAGARSARRSRSSPPRSSSAITTASSSSRLNVLDELRDENKKTTPTSDSTGTWPRTTWAWAWPSGSQEIPASTFQSVNPIFILLFGLVFTALWGFLGKRGWEPSTPVKFSLGLLQLGLGFAAFWYGAQTAERSRHGGPLVAVPRLPAARPRASSASRRSVFR